MLFYQVVLLYLITWNIKVIDSVIYNSTYPLLKKYFITFCFLLNYIFRLSTLLQQNFIKVSVLLLESNILVHIPIVGATVGLLIQTYNPDLILEDYCTP